MGSENVKEETKMLEDLLDPAIPLTETEARAAGSSLLEMEAAASLIMQPAYEEILNRRKNRAKELSTVTADMIMGATAMRAWASIDDVLDDRGNFDIKKARASGAIDLVRKLNITEGKYGRNISVEMYSNENAQDKLGNYIGMENAPKNSDPSESLRVGIEEVARAIAAGEEIQPEHRRLAWIQVREWALKRGALYPPDAIATVEREFGM